MTKESTTYERISKNIFYLRNFYGLSQKELANRTGVSERIIGLMETTGAAGRLDNLEDIATKGFGITITGLIELDLNKVLKDAIERYKIKKR